MLEALGGCIMSWLEQVKWSPLIRITDRWGEMCPTKSCGVYRLVGVSTDTGECNPVGIDRVCGRDASGTLYIGIGDSSLDGRLGPLIRSLKKMDGQEHVAAKRFNG